MIQAEEFFYKLFPNSKRNLWTICCIKLLKKLICQDEINRFITTYRHLDSFIFLEKIIEDFDVRYDVIRQYPSSHIPCKGRLIIIANHPIGSVDAFCLLKEVLSVRQDVRIVANQFLEKIEPLQPFFIPVDIMCSKRSYLCAFKKMVEAMNREEALIFFPAGEVSRLGFRGIRDANWQTGFLRLALKTHSPILPIYIHGKNSVLFYGLSMIYKPLGTMMLAQEMFKQKGKNLSMYVGNPIECPVIKDSKKDMDILSKKFFKHIFSFWKYPKNSLFKTYESPNKSSKC
jgi:1-acyl-sn-glycerol-3-phosphate acyltransferase